MQTSSGLDQDQNSQTSGDALILDGQLIKLGPTFVGESDQMSNNDTGAIELRSEGQEQGPRVDLTFRTLKIDYQGEMFIDKNLGGIDSNSVTALGKVSWGQQLQALWYRFTDMVDLFRAEGIEGFSKFVFKNKKTQYWGVYNGEVADGKGGKIKVENVIGLGMVNFYQG